MSDPTSTFELVKAESADIPRIAYIHVVACIPDNAFGLYFSDPKEFEKRVTEMLEDQFSDPTYQIIKAIDKKTGSIVAWASWQTPTDAQIRERDAKADANAAEKRGESGETLERQKGEFDFPAGIASYVEEDSSKWLEKATRGRRHMLTKAMFVDPPFQGKGIGTAMVAYGNRLADKAGLPIYLWGSAYGYPIYAKSGFETVQHLDLDLREWAPKAKGNDKGFGNYRFRYMVRLPLTL